MEGMCIFHHCYFLFHICPILSSRKMDKPVIAALKHFSSPLDVPSLSPTPLNTELSLQNSNVDDVHFSNGTMELLFPPSSLHF